MIKHEELENGNCVTLIEFGGDVLVGLRVSVDKTRTMLTLSNLDEKVEIGKNLPEFRGANLADLSNLVALIFNKVESIDVFINGLNKIKEIMATQNNEEGGSHA